MLLNILYYSYHYSIIWAGPYDRMFSKEKRRRIKKPLRKNTYARNYKLPFQAVKSQRFMAIFKSLTFKQRLRDAVRTLESYIRRIAPALPSPATLKEHLQRAYTRLQRNLPIAGGALLLCIAAWTANSVFDSGVEKTVLIEQALYPEASAHLHEDIPAGSNLIQRSVKKHKALRHAIPSPEQGFTVLAIDAGHGGIDPGSQGRGGLTEKEVTLDIAKRVREKLSSVDKLHVALTRYDDTTINIDSRTEVIKNIGANFVLSLHLNAIPQEHISLVESYYKTNRRADPNKGDFYIKSNSGKIKASYSLAKSVQTKVFETVKKHNKVSVDAGLKTSPMRILSQNSIPGALLEITCLSNPEEEKRLRTDAYLDELATGIAEGVKEFLQRNSKAITASL